MFKVSFKNVFDEKCLPVKKNESDAGWDIVTPYDIYLPEGYETVVDTGLIVQMDSDKACHYLVYPRSSASKVGLRIKNTVGVVDQSYCGPEDTLKLWFVRDAPLPLIKQDWSDAANKMVDSSWVEGVPKIVAKTSDGKTKIIPVHSRTLNSSPLLFKAGERIAQIVFLQHLVPEEVSFELKETVSRGGFGSTGR